LIICLGFNIIAQLSLHSESMWGYSPLQQLGWGFVAQVLFFLLICCLLYLFFLNHFFFICETEETSIIFFKNNNKKKIIIFILGQTLSNYFEDKLIKILRCYYWFGEFRKVKKFFIEKRCYISKKEIRCHLS
jgi:hypothetical protein